MHSSSSFLTLESFETEHFFLLPNFFSYCKLFMSSHNVLKKQTKAKTKTCKLDAFDDDDDDDDELVIMVVMMVVMVMMMMTMNSTELK